MSTHFRQVIFSSALERAGGGLVPWKEVNMLYWALVFFIVSIVAAVFGFTGIAVAAAGIAKILFFVFLVLFVLSLIFGMRPHRHV